MFISRMKKNWLQNIFLVLYKQLNLATMVELEHDRPKAQLRSSGPLAGKPRSRTVVNVML